MRRIVITAFAICLVSFAFAQKDSTYKIKTEHAWNDNRSNDNLMIQFGGTSWIGKPDSVHTKGFSRSLNMYLMIDFPFKTNPHWSVALGPGIATDNMYFTATDIRIRDNAAAIRFVDVSDTSHFKKYKLATAYLELPVELRYQFNTNKANSVKIALGAKVGTLLSAHTKGKELRDKNNNVLNTFIEKENSKRFFNKTRLSLEGRIGYGHYSIFASYSVTPLFKEGFGPVVRPLTIGLSIHGL